MANSDPLLEWALSDAKRGEPEQVGCLLKNARDHLARGELPPPVISEYLVNAFDAILENQDPKKALLLSNPPHRKKANVDRDIAIATAVREVMNCGNRRDQAIHIIAKQYHKSPSRIKKIYKQYRSQALLKLEVRRSIQSLLNRLSILDKVQSGFAVSQLAASSVLSFTSQITSQIAARQNAMSQLMVKSQRLASKFCSATRSARVPSSPNNHPPIAAACGNNNRWGH